MIVRCEGILIQLIFDHALRIRVNGTERQSREADAPNGKGKSKGNNLVGKLNNLATSDVANITVPGRDYLYIGNVWPLNPNPVAHSIATFSPQCPCPVCAGYVLPIPLPRLEVSDFGLRECGGQN